MRTGVRSLPKPRTHVSPPRDLLEIRPAPLQELPDLFLNEAERAKPYSATAARVWGWAAEWLRVALDAGLDEMLPINIAAAESGWSYEALRRRVSSDSDLNAGTPGAPAIRRRDLQRLGPPRARRKSAPAPSGAEAGAPGAAPASTHFERIKERALRRR